MKLKLLIGCSLVTCLALLSSGCASKRPAKETRGPAITGADQVNHKEDIPKMVTVLTASPG